MKNIMTEIFETELSPWFPSVSRPICLIYLISSTWRCNLFVYWPSASPNFSAFCPESLGRKTKNFSVNQFYDAPISARSSSRYPVEIQSNSSQTIWRPASSREPRSSWIPRQFCDRYRSPTAGSFYRESRLTASYSVCFSTLGSLLPRRSPVSREDSWILYEELPLSSPPRCWIRLAEKFRALTASARFN